MRSRLAIALSRLVCRMPPNVLVSIVRAIGRGAEPATDELAARARAVICDLSRRCAGEGCVQLSIAVVFLCRMYGSVPDWRTGFSFSPFVAHAWVEVGGRPIGESPEVSDYFVAHAVNAVSGGVRTGERS
ncbi:lasso peptide biosynthesis B2 protein [Nocardiopsis rhodophaea]